MTAFRTETEDLVKSNLKTAFRASLFRILPAAVIASLGFWWTPTPGMAAPEIAPRSEDQLHFKLGAASTAGFFVNVGSAGGAAPIVGGFRIRALLGIGEDFAFGPVLGTELDYSEFNVLFSSYGLGARGYLIGSGFPHKDSHPWGESESIDRFSLHLGAEMLNNSFFIGSNSSETSQTLTGSFLTLGGTTGIEYRLSRKVELTFDFNYGLATFAASDDRFRLNGYSLGFGLNYIW